MALRSALRTEAGGGRGTTYEFLIDGDTFCLRVGDGGEVEARQGPAPDPDLLVAGNAETLLAGASGRLGPEEAIESGALRVQGERGESQEALLAFYRHLILTPTA